VSTVIPGNAGCTIREEAVRLSREGLFSFTEWLDAFMLIETAAGMLSEREREQVRRTVAEWAVRVQWQPSDAASSLLAVMTYHRVVREVPRRGGGGKLAVDGRQYQRRLRARRWRRR